MTPKGLIGVKVEPQHLPFVALLLALDFEVGSIRGELLGLDPGKRYIALCFDDERSRAAAAFRIGVAAGRLNMDLALTGRAWDIETAEKCFLYWPAIGGPLA